MKLTESAIRDMVSRIITEMSAVDNPAIDKSLIIKYARAIYTLACLHVDKVKSLDIPPADPEEGFDPPEELYELNTRSLLEKMIIDFATKLGVHDVDNAVQAYMQESLASLEYMIVMSEEYGVPRGAERSFAYDTAIEAANLMISDALGLEWNQSKDLSHDEIHRRYQIQSDLSDLVKDALGTRASTYPANPDQGDPDQE